MLTIIEDGDSTWTVIAAEGELRIFSRGQSGEWTELSLSEDGDRVEADKSVMLEELYGRHDHEEDESQGEEEDSGEDEEEPEEPEMQEDEEPEMQEDEEPEMQEDEEPEEEPKKSRRRPAGARSKR